MTKVFFAKTRQLTGEEFEKAFAAADKERQKKVIMKKNPDDRTLSLFAGLLLKTALQREGIFEEVCFDKRGKPILKSGMLYLSLSHSGKRVMCALSDGEIGCDCQKQVPFSKKIPEKYFTENEKARLETAEDKEGEFARIWAAKESCVKMTGRGLSKLSAADTDAKGVFFKEYDLFDGYKYAVCSKEENFPEKMEEIEVF